MTTTPEEVSGSHVLTTAEQLFCTLTAWHERVSVYVKGGVANVVGAQWRVYAINGSQRTLLFQGSSKTLLNEVVIAGIPGQGDTIALYGLNPFGVTGSVKAYMVGWDPTAAVTPVQASSVAGVTLTLAEQDLSDLTGGYVNLDVAFNANGDPLAAQAQIRLYALLGGVDRFQLEKFQVPDIAPVPVGSVNLLQNYMAGASEFITTVQGRLGNSAVTVTGTLEGETGSAGAGGGGGPPVGSYWPTQTQLGAGVTNPLLEQAPATSDVLPQNITIRAQDAFAGATGANQVGGDLIVRMAVGTGSPVVDGAFRVRKGDASADTFAVQANGTVYAAIGFSGQAYVVRNDTDGYTPSISSTVADPPPVSAASPGSIVLSNGYYAMWAQNADGVYVHVAQFDAAGYISVDPAATVAGIRQEQATSAIPGVPFFVESQSAQTGGNQVGGNLAIMAGAPDFNPVTASDFAKVSIFQQLVAGGVPYAYDGKTFEICSFEYRPGGDNGIVLGRGTDGVGGGSIIGTEISSFHDISIDTENNKNISLGIVLGSEVTTAILNQDNHDTTDEAAWTLTYHSNHPTSGDAAGVRLNYTETAIGTGVPRYLDIQKASVRQFSIQPFVLGGAQLVAETGYLIAKADHVTLSSPDVEFNNSIFGIKLDLSAAQAVYDTQSFTTSVLTKVNTVAIYETSASQFQRKAGFQRHNNYQTADYQILATDDLIIGNVGSPGILNFTLPPTPSDGDAYSVFASGTGAISLIGNGRNIFLGTSAATKTVTTGTAATVVYDATDNLWLGTASL